MFIGNGVHISKEYQGGPAGAFPTAPLSSVIAGMVYQMDANLPASYPGTGQTFANVITAPADGAAQTAYDFFLGDSATPTTDDPTFVPGVYPVASKFTVDGGDRFRIQAMNAFLQNVHRSDTGQPFFFMGHLRVPNVATTQLIYGDSNGSTASGWRVEINGGNLRFVRADGTTNATTINLGAIAVDTDYLFVVHYTPATGAYKMAINSKTFTVTGTSAFPNAVAASGNIAYSGASGGSARPVAGSEFKGAGFGIGALTDTAGTGDLTKIMDYYNALHGTVYAA